MLPPTNFQPPFNITRASHLTLTSRDLAKARDFYTEVVGLKVSDESATTIYFRGVEERAHHSLTLRRTKDAPECERVGFRVSGEEELEKAKAWFDANGRPAKFVNLPFQGRTLHAADANRTPLEFCARMKTLDRAHTRVHEHKGAAALRMDHVQMLVPDVREASAMYLTLGFRVSDYSCAGARIVGMLLHRKDNPHDWCCRRGTGRGCIISDWSCRRCRTSCARWMWRDTSASAKPSNSGRAVMATRAASTCAIPMRTASHCCCRRFR